MALCPQDPLHGRIYVASVVNSVNEMARQAV
jgi:hypothetical protein